MGATAPNLPRLDPDAVLIVGEGNAARRCSHALVEQGGGKLRLAGVVPPAELAAWYAAPGPETNGGHPGNGRPPRRIVLALDDRRGALPVDELVRLRFQGIDVVDEQQFLQELTHKIPVTTIRPSDLVFSEGFKLNNTKLAAKVCVDWFIGAVLLALSLPLIGLAGLAIIAESGFPIFYRQDRVGRGGRTSGSSNCARCARTPSRTGRSSRPRTTRGSRASAAFCAASGSTSCRS